MKGFAVMYSATSRWDVAGFVDVDWAWPPEMLMPLGTVLKRVINEYPAATPKRDIPIIEKISFGGELTISDPEGRDTYKGRLFRAASGQLIYSKIRIKQGSVCVVPESTSSVGVSAEYPVYEVSKTETFGAYLNLVLRTSKFQAKLDGLAHGGDTKTRIHPDQFEALAIPLPPLATQRAIVAHWDMAQADAAMKERQAEDIERDGVANFLSRLKLQVPEPQKERRAFALKWTELERWSVSFHQIMRTKIDFSVGAFEPVLLGQVAVVSYGLQKAPGNRPGTHARPYLRVANVRRGELDLAEIKTINVSDKDMHALRLVKGDLLFVEGNGSRSELGRCAIWNSEIPECVHQNHILKVRSDAARLLPEFAMSWFNTDAGKNHFLQSAKSSSGLGTINSSELRNAPIPLPPLKTQADLVAGLTAARAHADALRTQARERRVTARTEVEAMILGHMPAPTTPPSTTPLPPFGHPLPQGERGKQKL